MKDLPLRRLALTLGGCLLAVYAMAYVDLVLRARSAYLEGEKYMEWHRTPALKAAHFNAELDRRVAGLRLEFSQRKLSDLELQQKLFLAKFERDQRAGESSLKYAHAWFQTAAELFSPPESKWVKLSRVRLLEAKALWKQELDAKKIPYEEYMLE